MDQIEIRKNLCALCFYVFKKKNTPNEFLR